MSIFNRTAIISLTLCILVFMSFGCATLEMLTYDKKIASKVISTDKHLSPDSPQTILSYSSVSFSGTFEKPSLEVSELTYTSTDIFVETKTIVDTKERGKKIKNPTVAKSVAIGGAILGAAGAGLAGYAYSQGSNPKSKTQNVNGISFELDDYSNVRRNNTLLVGGLASFALGTGGSIVGTSKLLRAWREEYTERRTERERSEENTKINVLKNQKIAVRTASSGEMHVSTDSRGALRIPLSTDDLLHHTGIELSFNNTELHINSSDFQADFKGLLEKKIAKVGFITTAKKLGKNRELQSLFLDIRSEIISEGAKALGMYSTKSVGARVLLPVEILQALGGFSALATAPLSGRPTTIYLSFKSMQSLVDGQPLAIEGVITGTHSYTTTLGAKKTVPKISVTNTDDVTFFSMW